MREGRQGAMETLELRGRSEPVVIYRMGITDAR